MHNWRKGSAVILGLFLATVQPSWAANWACGQDINGDGEISTWGETGTCFESPTGGQLCPVSAVSCTSNQVMACEPGSAMPLNFSVNFSRLGPGNTEVSFDLVAGTFSTAQSGVTGSVPTLDYDAICTNGHPVAFSLAQVWDAPSFTQSPSTNVNRVVVQAPSCSNNLQGIVRLEDNSGSVVGGYQVSGSFEFATTQETCSLTTEYGCPLGGGYSCMENSTGTQQCSPNTCVDLDSQPPVTEDINTDMFQDDGARASDGTCLGQMLIFSGRSMRCDKAGVSTAFQNCCKNTGKVLADDTGDSGSPTQTITQLFDALTQGRSEYEAALAAGAPTLVASNLAANKATDVMGDYGAVMNPVAMAGAVVDYFTQSCDQTSTETGVLNGSGFCYEIGEYCREKWEFVGCVQKSKSYCCFNSKMARIIHQQGRSQLNTIGGFGSPENPDCRGLTPEEFQSIDFSKIDFSEYYGDLVPDTQAQMTDKVNDGITDFFNSAQ